MVGSDLYSSLLVEGVENNREGGLARKYFFILVGGWSYEQGLFYFLFFFFTLLLKAPLFANSDVFGFFSCSFPVLSRPV